MKKLAIISILSLAVVVVGCDGIKRERSREYMPDMRDSRAYETYADHSNLATHGINYTNQPVSGTVARGEEMPYHLKNDSSGYAASMGVANPLPMMNSVEATEAERLFLINCAICHGPKLDGNGPLYKGGTGPYAAKPATLVGDPKIEALSEGTYFHVMTYGKNLMGSYASQLNRKQRWMIAQYIKGKQTEARTGVKAGTASADTAASAAPKDTTAAAK
jgi:mono/diheme cytochrome c family protein